MCECFAKWFDRLELTFVSTAQPPAAAYRGSQLAGRPVPAGGWPGRPPWSWPQVSVVMATRFAVDFGYGRRSCAARSRAPDGAHLQSRPGLLPGPRGDEARPGPVLPLGRRRDRRALRERPCMLHRFPTGVAGEKVHQKRVPGGAPPWLETVRVDFPRYGRHADELCVTELASVIWAVQMSTVEFHPWNSRRADTERPDEWRIDLDPMPDCGFGTVRRVAHVVHEVLDELGAVGWPKTSAATGCTSTCASSHGGASAMCGEPRWPSPAKSSAGHRGR